MKTSGWFKGALIFWSVGSFFNTFQRFNFFFYLGEIAFAIRNPLLVVVHDKIHISEFQNNV